MDPIGQAAPGQEAGCSEKIITAISAIIASAEGQGRCIKQPAMTAKRNAKCLLSQQKESQCSAGNAMKSISPGGFR